MASVCIGNMIVGDGEVALLLRDDGSVEVLKPELAGEAAVSFWSVFGNPYAAEIQRLRKQLAELQENASEAKAQWNIVASTLGADGDNVDQVFERAARLAKIAEQWPPKTAYDAIRLMPSRTHADYVAILRRHVLELRELSAGLANDMMGLASGDASCFYFASDVSGIASVIGIMASQIERMNETGMVRHG